jgi:NAD(P)-dependent dehydrogenase (short-subunit alcohol dehydrogenase family)
MAQKTWLVTGVNSGFGRLMVEKLLNRGDRVFGTVRTIKAVENLVSTYPDRFRSAELDMTDFTSIRSVVDGAFDAFGTIDVIVSNAGYGLFGAAEEVSDDQVLHQINTNLIGCIQLIRSALPHLRRQGGGRIIQLSSMHGQAAFPGSSLYHASKWGIEGFVDSVSQEVAPFGIGCTIVEPGAARTDFRHRSAELPPKIDAYDISPARNPRRLFEDPSSQSPGDPDRMVDIMIASVEQEPAPRRITLGRDAFDGIHRQLQERLTALTAQKELAYSTDVVA